MKNFKIDIIVTLLFVFILFMIFNALDFFELIYQTTRKYEQWELDEVFLLIIAIPLPLLWFVYRRFKNEKKQFDDLLQMENRLARIHRLEALGVLASGMAHEINNQLQPVISMADMMNKSTPTSDPHHRKIELILAGANNAKKTVEKIKEFSRPSHKDEQCEVLPAFQEVKDLIQAAKPSHIELLFDISETFNSQILVSISSENFQGIIVNLVNNSWDALEESGGIVKVSIDIIENGAIIADLDLADKKYLCLEVEDNGKGMNEKTQEKVFDPFFTTKAVGKGIGLGLSIVYSTVTQAQGDVSVQSLPDGGSIFVIYLPVIE